MLMTRRLFLVPLILVVRLAAPAQGQSGAAPDIGSLGPRVGVRAPDFAGVDQFGRSQTLQSVLGPEGAMLVFFRSADW
jgi:hypothetical protein